MNSVLSATFKVNACPVCMTKSAQKLTFKGMNDLSGIIAGEFWIKRCGVCECLYLHNPIKRKNLHYAYPASYHCYRKSVSIVSCVKEYVVKAEIKMLLELSGKEKPHILEIGAGTGLYSRCFKKMGCAVYATDINKKSLQDLENEGIFGILGEFEKIDFGERKFDIIVMSHVLEHFQDPILVFSKIERILKKKGLVYIKTPSADSIFVSRIFRDLDVPRHHVIFSKKGIAIISKEAFIIKKLNYEINTNEFIVRLNDLYHFKNFSIHNPFLIGLFFYSSIYFEVIGEIIEVQCCFTEKLACMQGTFTESSFLY